MNRKAPLRLGATGQVESNIQARFAANDKVEELLGSVGAQNGFTVTSWKSDFEGRMQMVAAAGIALRESLGLSPSD